MTNTEIAIRTAARDFRRTHRISMQNYGINWCDACSNVTRIRTRHIIREQRESIKCALTSMTTTTMC